MQTEGVIKTKDQLIDETMDWFDFGKVRKAMVALDWTWVFAEDGVPYEAEIRQTARDLLTRAYDQAERTGQEYSIATGGLVARYDPSYNWMQLQFVVTDWIACGNPDAY